MNTFFAVLFLLPAMAIYGVFSFYPTIATIVTSFFAWDDVLPTGRFVGLANYVPVVTDSYFWNALKHNAVFLVLALIVPVGFGLILAIFIAGLKKGHALYRALLFLPAVFSGVVVAYVWAWIYHPFVGILNQVLQFLGLGFLKQSWLGNSDVALYAIFATYAWVTFGYAMVIFLAALQNIDPELYDAARVDGATFLQQHRHVTIPMLRNVLTFIWTLHIITGMGVFDVVFVLTKGGPFFSTDVISVYMYRLISTFEMGWATAAATIQGVFTLLLVRGFMYLRERAQ